MRQTEQTTPPLPMEGIWIVDSRPDIQPYFVNLDDHVSMKTVIYEIQQKEEDDVVVIPYVEGLSSEQVISLSARSFDARRGLITVKAKNPLAEARSTILAAERLELYHLHALQKARESTGMWGASVNRLAGTDAYKDFIEETTYRDRERYKLMRKMLQRLRAITTHPSEAVERRIPPPIDFMEIRGLPEEIRLEVESLYYMELPEDGPVLKSARKRRDKRDEEDSLV